MTTNVSKFKKALGRCTVVGDCLIWEGKATTSKTRDGYGVYSKQMAHRIAYEVAVGPIPEGLQIDHLCGNTLCVNFEHLEPVTPEENMRRRTEATTHCAAGHEFTPENTRVKEGRWRVRICRACDRERQRRCKARRAAAAQ